MKYGDERDCPVCNGRGSSACNCKPAALMGSELTEAQVDTAIGAALTVRYPRMAASNNSDGSRPSASATTADRSPAPDERNRQLPEVAAAIERVRAYIAFGYVDAGWAATLDTVCAAASRAVAREPTQAMKRAGDKRWSTSGTNDDQEMCGEIWKAMYDAAEAAPGAGKP